MFVRFLDLNRNTFFTHNPHTGRPGLGVSDSLVTVLGSTTSLGLPVHVDDRLPEDLQHLHVHEGKELLHVVRVLGRGMRELLATAVVEAVIEAQFVAFDHQMPLQAVGAIEAAALPAIEISTLRKSMVEIRQLRALASTVLLVLAIRNRPRHALSPIWMIEPAGLSLTAAGISILTRFWCSGRA